MKKEELYIESKIDKLKLSVAIFTPEKEVKGIIQISHGMAEHKERYYELMEYLTKEGFVTIINDHRGHGKSIKDENDLGYFYDETSDFIVEDLKQITEYIKDKYKNKEVILLGHSMGSLVVRKYIKKYDNLINKLIICGSPSKNNLVNLGLLLTKIIKIIKKDKYRSKLINNITFASYNKNFDKKEKFSWLTTTKEELDKNNEDKLCGYIFTINGFINLFKLTKEVYKLNDYEVNNKNLNILFIQGDKDPVIGNIKKWNKSINYLKQIGYKKISSKLYKNYRHEILLDKCKKEVYKDILKFIEKGNI